MEAYTDALGWQGNQSPQASYSLYIVNVTNPSLDEAVDVDAIAHNAAPSPIVPYPIGA